MIELLFLNFFKNKDMTEQEKMENLYSMMQKGDKIEQISLKKDL